MKTIKLIAIGYFVFLLAACSNDVDFGEQYKKIVYIVNSKDKIVKTQHGLVEKSDGFITFYCGGTEPLKKDLVIHYTIDTNALHQFNKTEYGEDNKSKYLVYVPEENVTFHEPSVTIKAGEEYGILHFSINTVDLNPGAKNAIPISITEVSDGEINSGLKTLFYQLSLVTPYSGTYESATVSYDFFTYKETKNISKTVIPLSRNSVRIPLNQKEVQEGNNNYFDVIVNTEDNTLTLSSPRSDIKFLNPVKYRKNSSDPLTDIPTNYYNPETNEIVIGYNITSNVWVNYVEVLRLVK